MTISAPNKAHYANKPKAVMFDIDNTLYAYDPAHEKAMQAVVEKAKHALNIYDKDFMTAFTKAREITKKRLGGTAACHSRLLYMQQTLELLGLKTQLYIALDLEQTYWRTFMTAAELFPGVKEFLQAVRRAGIATCVVTDLGTQIQFRKLIYFGLQDAFDYVVTSEEAGAEKPDAAPFELALDKLGVAAEETIMIGDNAECDIVGAREVGMATAQKRHLGVFTFADERRADITFDHFTELEQHLANYGWLDAGPKKNGNKKS